MGSRSSFRRVPAQLVHEQLNKLRAELGVLRVKLEAKFTNTSAYVQHIEAGDQIAADLQRQLLPPYEEPTKPAVETDVFVEEGGVHSTFR